MVDSPTFIESLKALRDIFCSELQAKKIPALTAGIRAYPCDQWLAFLYSFVCFRVNSWPLPFAEGKI